MKDLDRIMKHYADFEKEHGRDTTIGKTGWGTKETQDIRFDIISQLILRIINDNENIFTLLDIGCGYCDFYHYWSHLSNVPKIIYTGIDARMLNIEGDLDVWKDDVSNPSDKTIATLTSFDIIIASGLFSFWNQSAIRSCVRMIYEIMKPGTSFIFNLLRECDGVPPELKPTDPVSFFKFLNSISLNMNMIADYKENDMTFQVMK